MFGFTEQSIEKAKTQFKEFDFKDFEEEFKSE